MYFRVVHKAIPEKRDISTVPHLPALVLFSKRPVECAQNWLFPIIYADYPTKQWFEVPPFFLAF